MLLSTNEIVYCNYLVEEFGEAFGTNATPPPPEPLPPLPPRPERLRYRSFWMLSDSDKKDILDARRAGASWKGIEVRFNISLATIQKLQAEAGYSYSNPICPPRRASRV